MFFVLFVIIVAVSVHAGKVASRVSHAVTGMYSQLFGWTAGIVVFLTLGGVSDAFGGRLLPLAAVAMACEASLLLATVAANRYAAKRGARDPGDDDTEENTH